MTATNLQAAPDAVNEIRSVIVNLDKAKFSTVREGWSFDYGFEPLAGMLNTFEYVRSLKNYEAVNKMFSMDIFLSGPHSKSKLNLTDAHSFGHYNPEFVRYFHSVINIILSEEVLISATHEKMKKYGIIHKLQRLQYIYRHINSNKVEFNSYKNKYKKQLANKTWKEGSYTGHMPKTFNQSKYWNWSESVYHFWIRRSIDGTMTLWNNIINDILNAYSEDSLSSDFTKNM